MTDHKFTDEEVIKALECCAEPLVRCEICPYKKVGDMCFDKAKIDALALINRQKIKIEELESNLKFVRGTNRRLIENESVVRTEAYKEFAERLLKKIYPYNGVDKKQYAINARAVEIAIEDLVKK